MLPNVWRELKKCYNLFLPLPLIALAYCLLYAYVFNYDEAIRTHCLVDNFAMSISSTISEPASSHLVWTAAVIMHLPARFILVAEMKRYYDFYSAQKGRIQDNNDVRVVSGLATAEILSLFGLTVMTSDEQFVIHMCFFACFVTTSVLYMCLATRMQLRVESWPPESKVVHAKYALNAVVLISLVMMSYLYHRHNKQCEPYVYSYFCLSEYALVTANMVYHIISPWHFHRKKTLANRRSFGA